MHRDLAVFCLKKESTLREAMSHIDRSRLGIVLIVDAARRLVGTITDGDLRRAILVKMDLECSVNKLLDRKKGSSYVTPITAKMGQDSRVYIGLLKKHDISHLPILDDNGCVAGLVTLDEFVPSEDLPLSAVVMAGGSGRRLHPLTKNTPKPMLDVGGRPILEIIIQHLQESGIRKVKVATHYHSQKIEQYFGDGNHLGVDLSFAREGEPLGTIGGLGLLETPNETTLVINGDILTQVDFRAMLSFHREHQADLTVTVRPHTVDIPYGVIECEGPEVKRITEKPVLNYFINAGIYLMEPHVYRFIPQGRKYDMTDLIQSLLRENRPVVSFPVREDWMDIGRHSEYEKARSDSEKWKVSP